MTIYLCEEPEWADAADHLIDVEDEVMKMKREGAMTSGEARIWIARNIQPLEDEFENDGPSQQLLDRCLALEPPNHEIANP